MGKLTLAQFGLTPAAIRRHVTKITTAPAAYRAKVQRPVSLLERLGLTREAIMRHVVSIAPPVQPCDLDWRKVARAKQKAQRQANLAAGLTSHGTPRIRKLSPTVLGVVRNGKKTQP